jgi:hypothetical protein
VKPPSAWLDALAADEFVSGFFILPKDVWLTSERSSQELSSSVRHLAIRHQMA